MRRALGWLLPGHAAGGPLASFSSGATPGWLHHAAEAIANTASAASGEARCYSTRAGSLSTAGPPSLPSTSGCVPPAACSVNPAVDLGSGLSSTSASSSMLTSPPLYSPSLSSASSTVASTAPMDDSILPSISSAASTTTTATQHLDNPLSHDVMASTLDACTAAESSLFMSLVQQIAGTYEFVHTTTGLPWAASIPLTTLALRLALLPLSMRQARIIRTNYSIYKEALTLTAQQEQEAREREEQLRLEERAAASVSADFRPSTSASSSSSSSAAAEAGVFGGSSNSSRSSSSMGLHQSYSTSSQPAAAAAAGLASTQQQQEAADPSQQQQQRHTAQPTSSSASSSSSSPPSEEDLAAAVYAKWLYSQAVLANFDMLRRKCDAPHWVWIVVNPLVQIPVFVGVSATLGMMCRANWTGLSSEGVLWFPDLTLPAFVMDSGDMPLGLAGFALPLIVYGMTMTSLRLAFGASGVAAQRAAAVAGPTVPGAAGGPEAETLLTSFLRSLPPLLYTMTTLSLYFKVQMAHGVLVHWLGSAGFTLSLQMALRNPTLRSLLKLNPGARSPAGTTLRPGPLGPTTTITDSPSSSSSDATTAAADASDRSVDTASSPPAPSSSSSSSPSAGLPRDLETVVAAETDPNVLVIMGAQLSARHEYTQALYCLRKAVLLRPSHVRAHYSMGQVYTLIGCFEDAELSYRAAAELSPEGTERGQALYCAASALHTMGKLEEAAAVYAEADAQWRGQTVIAYSRANALAAAGRRQEALAALEEAEARNEASREQPFKEALARLRKHLTRTEGEGGEGAGEAGSGGEEKRG
ncbi:hypothetical protein Agub_g6276 [Astrephomene gubernaculifera]|uniref:Uncharacterized protein n=1 Tax=Astrephomene gubernaculifera TaxID=47775 RepID=A0AAD3DN64_9CHLO|nr:hypothetical protein Agub_g6276 [Astrephomene gubernaculifera]